MKLLLKRTDHKLMNLEKVKFITRGSSQPISVIFQTNDDLKFYRTVRLQYLNNQNTPGSSWSTLAISSAHFNLF